jgi:hypothetical protein
MKPIRIYGGGDPIKIETLRKKAAEKAKQETPKEKPYARKRRT